MGLLSTLLKKSGSPRFDAPILPEAPFYAIGDIHGAYTAMEALLTKIDAESQDEPVVCVGDLIDRGPRSADVLTWLRHLTETYPGEFVCLKGNHEVMLSDFIDDPENNGRRWLRHGGLQTLESYRLSRTSDQSLTDLRDGLLDAMGRDTVDWLRALPTTWQSGNVMVTHAGADPALPVDEQPEINHLWGHRDFFSTPREDGIWVVYGHQIVEHPGVGDGRIAIDTGAYATDRLTAARIAQGGVSFLTSTD